MRYNTYTAQLDELQLLSPERCRDSTDTLQKALSRYYW